VRNRLIVLCILGASCVAWSQHKPDTWENLNSLHTGQKILVFESNSKKISGEFQSVSETAISVEVGGGVQEIQREEVRSVKLRSSHRLRNALIIAGIGGGVGAGIGAATFHSCGNEFLCIQPGGRALPAGIFGLTGALGGAAVGALLPAHSTIYKAGRH
jgi:hypothetical protein